jgi:hypothetical protein
MDSQDFPSWTIALHAFGTLLVVGCREVSTNLYEAMASGQVLQHFPAT